MQARSSGMQARCRQKLPDRQKLPQSVVKKQRLNL
jgi:hypothetical protein